LSRRAKMSTATGDARIAELQRQLGVSQQTASRLEHELASTKQTLERERSARPRTPRELPKPPCSPCLEKELSAAKARASQLEEELASTKQATDRLQDRLASARSDAEGARKEAHHLQAELDSQSVEVQRLRDELSRRSATPSGECTRDALAKARKEAETLRMELENESERRRSLQRRLDDALRNGKATTGPLRVPEPPPPPRVMSAEEEREQEAAEEKVRQMIKSLDGRLGKLEHRKETTEVRLERQVRELTSQVASLERQLLAAKNIAAAGAAGAVSPRAHLGASLGAASARAAVSFGGRTRSGAVVADRHGRPVSREQLIASALGLGGDASSSTEPAADKRGAAKGSGGGNVAVGGFSARDPMQRLQKLDPNAAAQIVERKQMMSALRARLIDAQAQDAVDVTRVRTSV
jgi:predicted RNase H-like nuclease (RuvC/YqgF family)